MSYGITQLLKSTWETWVENIFGFGIAWVRFIYWPVIIITIWFPDFARGDGSIILIGINSSRPLGGISCSWRWCLNVSPIRGQSWQCETVLYTFVYILGRTYIRRNVSYIWRSHGWPSRVGPRAKWGIIGHIKCGTTFCMAALIGDSLTESPLLSKLNADPGTPTVGQILAQ